MTDDNKLFQESLIPNFRTDSFLSIKGIFPKKYKPRITFEMGRAWKKIAQNGHTYYKMRFDDFITPSGKPLYAEARPRRNEPDVYYASILRADYPFEVRNPFLIRGNQLSA